MGRVCRYAHAETLEFFFFTSPFFLRMESISSDLFFYQIRSPDLSTKLISLVDDVVVNYPDPNVHQVDPCVLSVLR